MDNFPDFGAVGGAAAALAGSGVARVNFLLNVGATL